MILLVPTALYLLVGVLSLRMAYKCLFSKKFIPFHEKAAAMPWDQIAPSLQAVIMALMRVSGFGFLVVAVLLLVFPAANRLLPNVLMEYLIPMTSSLFCSGLFWANYRLHQKTKAPTPWKGALVAFWMLVAGMIISSL